MPRHLLPGLAHRVVQSLAREGGADRMRSEPDSAALADRVWVTPPRLATDRCAALKQHMPR